jgi:hypothetical protein
LTPQRAELKKTPSITSLQPTVKTTMRRFRSIKSPMVMLSPGRPPKKNRDRIISDPRALSWAEVFDGLTNKNDTFYGD